MSEDLKVLDLTPAEEKTLQVLLGGKTLSVSALAREAILPRMTVRACLDRLHKRGLVRHEGTTYRSLWKIVGREKLKRRLWEGLTYLDSKLSRAELSERIGVQISETTEFFVFKGVDSIQKLYLWFFLNHFGMQVRAIQAHFYSETVIRKLGCEKMSHINDSIKQNRLIFQAVLPEGVKDIYESIAHDPSLLTSIVGMNAATHLVPDSLFQFKSDLILSSKIGIFANWNEEIAVLIRNHDFTKVLAVFYDLFISQGVAFDQDAYVTRLIEQQHKSV